MVLSDLWRQEALGYALSSSDTTGSRSPSMSASEPGPTNPWKVLTIKPQFLARILSGEKSWEVRSQNSLYRGCVALVGSGTRKIWGRAFLIGCTWKTEAEIRAASAACLTTAEVRRFCQGSGAYVWILSDVQVFQTPVCWHPVPGCVTWSSVKSDLALQIESAAISSEVVSRSQLLQSMNRTKATVVQGQKGQKRKYGCR